MILFHVENLALHSTRVLESINSRGENTKTKPFGDGKVGNFISFVFTASMRSGKALSRILEWYAFYWIRWDPWERILQPHVPNPSRNVLYPYDDSR